MLERKTIYNLTSNMLKIIEISSLISTVLWIPVYNKIKVY